MPVRDFKILSIDGGGIKGLFAASILQAVEEKYGPTHQYFDLICGTSTGGIIALGLGAELSAQEIVNFYELEGPKIFASNGRLQRKIALAKQLIWGAKYSAIPLQSALTNVFKDKTMGESKTRLCIPAVDLKSSSGVVFKTPHHGSFVRDGKIKMADVALATSAAPTYFPIAKIESKFNRLVDGGLWANNPALIGTIEAMSYFVGEGKSYNKISILSLSNLNFASGLSSKTPANASIWHWRSALIETTLTAQSKGTQNIMEIAHKNMVFPFHKYVRIHEPEILSNDLNRIQLDRADTRTLEFIKELGFAQSTRYLSNADFNHFFFQKQNHWK